MANICTFQMKVVGKSKENIETFFNMMSQQGTVWMGRGAEVSRNSIEEENNIFYVIIDGWCKWSVEASMVTDAISMRTHPEKWSFGKKHNEDKLKFITLYEACKELTLDMEAYSAEPGCEFQEHILFRNGKLEVNESTEYTEEWDDEEGEFVSNGGYKWEFEI